MARPGSEIRWHLSQHWKLACLAGVLIVAATAWIKWINQNADRSGRPVTAKITAFGYADSRWQASQVVVHAVDVDGVTGIARVEPGRISGCKVGDDIRGQRDGVRLMLDPAPCSPAKP